MRNVYLLLLCLINFLKFASTKHTHSPSGSPNSNNNDSSDTPAVGFQGRYDAACAMVGTTLYCFGGSYGDSGGSQSSIDPVQNQFVSVDLSNVNGNSAQANGWTNVQVNSNNYTAKAMNALGAVSLSDTTMLILTNKVYNAGDIQNGKAKAMIYHTDSGELDIVDAGHLSTIGEATLNADSQGNAYLWGGEGYKKGENVNEPTSFTVVQDSSNAPSLSTVSSTLPFTSSYGEYALYGHAAAMVGTKLFVVGGLRSSSSTAGNDASPYSLNNILCYDTVLGTWSEVSATGTTIPASRTGHSLTYLPKTNQLLMYGGQSVDDDTQNLELLTKRDGNQILDDVYTLDVNTNTWTQRASGSDNNGPGARTGHSATLLNQLYMVVAFGLDDTGNPLKDIALFDTVAFKWLPAPTLSTPPTVNPTTTSTTVTTTTSAVSYPTTITSAPTVPTTTPVATTTTSTDDDPYLLPPWYTQGPPPTTVTVIVSTVYSTIIETPTPTPVVVTSYVTDQTTVVSVTTDISTKTPTPSVTSEPDSSTATPTQSEGGLDNTAILGIAIASAILAACCLGGLLFWYFRRRKHECGRDCKYHWRDTRNLSTPYPMNDMPYDSYSRPYTERMSGKEPLPEDSQWGSFRDSTAYTYNR